jgi:hypothetical protein
MLAARRLLAGNGVAHRWIDTDADPVGRLLAEHVGLGVERPVAVFADGSRLEAPEEFISPAPGHTGREAERAAAVPERRVGMVVPARTPPQQAEAYLKSTHWRSELARRAGLHTQPEHEDYDAVIVGAGPAGLHRCGLRPLRGPAHGRPRTPGSGGPGGDQREDRELPRLPARH